MLAMCENGFRPFSSIKKTRNLSLRFTQKHCASQSQTSESLMPWRKKNVNFTKDFHGFVSIQRTRMRMLCLRWFSNLNTWIFPPIFHLDNKFDDLSIKETWDIDVKQSKTKFLHKNWIACQNQQKNKHCVLI